MAVDMSPAAIEARLNRVSQLRNLCIMLGKAVPVQEQIDAKATTPHAPAMPQLPAPEEAED